MLPLKDNVPTARLPLITMILIAVNLVVFAWQLSLPDDSASSPRLARLGVYERQEASLRFGVIPARITSPGTECELLTGGAEVGSYVCGDGRGDAAGAIDLDAPPWWQTLLSAIFMHGGWVHLLGNMLFLWIFGNNVEASMGRGRFLSFYLLAGLIASYAQAALDPGSAVPMIGASGAIAGILGGYALLYPRAKVLSLVLIVFFVTLIEVPAMLLLGGWFVLQFLPVLGQLSNDGLDSGGIAYIAHVGGFLFGLATIRLFTRRIDTGGSHPPYPVG